MVKSLGYVILAFALAVVPTFAFTGSIVSSFVSPHGSYWPKGIDYYNGYLYHNAYNRLYVTTTTGSIVTTLNSRAATMGVDMSGTYIWTCSYIPARVYQLNTAGSILSSFAGPGAGYGLALDGNYFWYSAATTDTIYRITTTGSVVTSFPHPGSFAGDLDFDGTYLWIADWPSANGGIYKVTTKGSLVDSMVPAPGAGRPSGCCWDGNYLWYHDYKSPYLVIQCRVAYASVAPTSFGKVKALFR